MGLYWLTKYCTFWLTWNFLRLMLASLNKKQHQSLNTSWVPVMRAGSECAFLYPSTMHLECGLMWSSDREPLYYCCSHWLQGIPWQAQQETSSLTAFKLFMSAYYQEFCVLNLYIIRARLRIMDCGSECFKCSVLTALKAGFLKGKLWCITGEFNRQ